MKKAILATLLSATALTLFAAPADAAQKKTETEVGVQFKSDDPTVESGMKPYRNNLSVVFRPGSFEFGEVKSKDGQVILNNQKGTNGGLEVDGTGTISKTNQYLVVNDDRTPKAAPGAEESTATNSAWALTAQLSELTTTKANEKLDNAKLEFDVDGLKKYDISSSEIDPEDNDYIPVKPWETGVVTDFTTNDSGVAAPDKLHVTLEAGVNEQKAILTKAQANKYKGGVITALRDVKLTVLNANQGDKAFTGTVTWTLDDLAVVGG